MWRNWRKLLAEQLNQTPKPNIPVILSIMVSKCPVPSAHILSPIETYENRHTPRIANFSRRESGTGLTSQARFHFSEIPRLKHLHIDCTWYQAMRQYSRTLQWAFSNILTACSSDILSICWLVFCLVTRKFPTLVHSSRYRQRTFRTKSTFLCRWTNRNLKIVSTTQCLNK